jgi:RND family efflux transporter MFP subunit
VLPGCSHHKPAAAPLPLPVVQTITLQRSSVIKTLPLVGTLNALPRQEVTISPQVGGTLLSLKPELNESVQQGEIVAQVSSQQAASQLVQAAATLGQDQTLVQQAEANALQQEAQTKAGIAQANANLRNAEAALDGASATLTANQATAVNAQQNLSRQTTLLNEGLVSQKDLENAQLAVLTAKSAVDVQKKQIDSQAQTVEAQKQALAAAKTGALLDLVKRKDILVAQQQVKNAEAALTAARAQAALYTLRAPITGKITNIGASPGESVDTTTKLLTIANLSRLQLVIGVPSNNISSVHPGQTVQFQCDVIPGKTFSATIETIASQTDPATGTVAVYATVDNRAGILKDNMTASAKIVVYHHDNVITTPLSSLLSNPDAGTQSVAIVDANSVMHIVQVTTGASSNGRIEITSGVSVGQKIVVSGQYGLTDGTVVTVHATDTDQRSAQNGS